MRFRYQKCATVFPLARAVAAAKTQTVEKLREITPLYYYHFWSSFTYKTYIRVPRVAAYVIYPQIFFFFFLPLSDSLSYFMTMILLSFT